MIDSVREPNPPPVREVQLVRLAAGFSSCERSHCRSVAHAEVLMMVQAREKCLVSWLLTKDPVTIVFPGGGWSQFLAQAGRSNYCHHLLRFSPHWWLAR